MGFKMRQKRSFKDATRRIGFDLRVLEAMRLC
jgi:hypothetical protein